MKKKIMIALIVVAAIILLLAVWFNIPYSPVKTQFKKVLNKCIDHFKKHGCNEKADRLFAILNNKNVATKKIGSGLKNVTSFQLIELARRVGSELELDRQNKNIRFLSSWQKLMNSDTVENVQALYKKSVKLVKKGTQHDKVCTHADLVCRTKRTERSGCPANGKYTEQKVQACESIRQNKT